MGAFRKFPFRPLVPNTKGNNIELQRNEERQAGSGMQAQDDNRIAVCVPAVTGLYTNLHEQSSIWYMT